MIVPITNAARDSAVSTYHSRRPDAAPTTPVETPRIMGAAKLRSRLSAVVRRHAISGPTPIRNTRPSASGPLTRLKNGGPTVIFTPRTASESTGKIVPQKTANAIPTRNRLLNRNAASRDRYDSKSAGLRSCRERKIKSAL